MVQMTSSTAGSLRAGSRTWTGSIAEVGRKQVTPSSAWLMASLAMHLGDTYLDFSISPVCAHTCACAMNMCGNQRTACRLLLPGTALRLPALVASALKIYAIYLLRT